MKLIIPFILLIYLLYILNWQRKKLMERFGETGESGESGESSGDRITNVTKTITAAFTKTISDLFKLKKDLVLYTTGKIHVKVR